MKRFNGYLRRKLRSSVRRWLKKNPAHRKSLRKSRCFSAEPRVVSRGVAIGLFFGLTPTVGFQTMLVLPCCLLFRGNFPLAFLATWVTNPLTIPPAYYAFNRVGNWLHPGSLISRSTAELYPWLDLLTAESTKLVIGGAAIAAPVAFLGYFATYGLLSWRKSERDAAAESTSLSSPRS